MAPRDLTTALNWQETGEAALNGQRDPVHEERGAGADELLGEALHTGREEEK